MAKGTTRTGSGDAAPSIKKEPDVCGLIMPIAGMQGYEPTHFLEVRTVLERAIVDAGFLPKAVWEGGEADIIHDRIIGNLFENPIIICDVSGLNPNVMLELGLRLSFAKPTIIVTDDIGQLPFDTKMIEHHPYPRDLHLMKTERFMGDLTDRIKSISDAVENNRYKPFIRNFRGIEPGALAPETRPADQVLMERMDQLSSEIRRMRRNYEGATTGSNYWTVNPARGTGKSARFASMTSSSNIVLKTKPERQGAALSVLASAVDIPGLQISIRSPDTIALSVPLDAKPDAIAALGQALVAAEVDVSLDVD